MKYFKIDNKNRITGLINSESELNSDEYLIASDDAIRYYYKCKNSNTFIYYENGIIISKDESKIIEKKEEIKIHIHLELNKTDRTQLLDSGLSQEKTIEFANYREELRVILRNIDTTDPFSINIPVRPIYE